MEHVTENNKREGDKFGDGICPGSQEKAIEEKSKLLTCVSRYVDLVNTDREMEAAEDT